MLSIVSGEVKESSSSIDASLTCTFLPGTAGDVCTGKPLGLMPLAINVPRSHSTSARS
uniref:Uncharacterized protein n=1 Tax=Nelumbo nucifera TaxID=4432 RepID=A0A822ZE48_NELNU|nr:TPA_asm: hypothetical protein HUJ06_001642 [Nelumbo nucifera]